MYFPVWNVVVSLIDSDALFLQSNEIANRLSELEEQAYVLAGQPFNLASTKQLQGNFVW